MGHDEDLLGIEEVTNKAEEERKAYNRFLQQQDHDIVEILKTDAGMRVFSWIMAEGHVLQSDTPGRNNDYFFRQGERNLAVKLFDRIASIVPDKAAALVLDLAEVRRLAKEKEDAGRNQD